MTVLRPLLLVPLLAPLAVVILVGALNPRPVVRLRLLTTTSPALPIGTWMMLAAGGGGLLSAGSTTLALRTGNGRGSRRQVRRPIGGEPAGTAPAAGPPRTPTDLGAGAPGPSRPPGEPAPTVAVPFRVIRRPTTSEPTSATSGDGWDDSPSDW